MRILGLDPGSRVCGYGVIDAIDRSVAAAAPVSPTNVGSSIGSDLRYVECGILTAPEDRPMELRLGEIARALTEVVNELRPDVVAVEDVFSHQNPRSALALAQARGMVLAVIGLAGIQVTSYAPAAVKKAVSGSGRAEKDQVARMVQMLIGLRSLPRADATDALAVAITHGRTVQPSAVRITSAVVRARAASTQPTSRASSTATARGSGRLASAILPPTKVRP